MRHGLAIAAALGLISCSPAVSSNGSLAAAQAKSPAEGRAKAVVGRDFATSIHAENVIAPVAVPAVPDKDDRPGRDNDRFEFSFELEDRTQVSCGVTSAQAPAAQSLQRRFSEALGSSKVTDWVTSGPWVVQDRPLFFVTAKLAKRPAGDGSTDVAGTSPTELELNGSSAVVGDHLLQCTHQGPAGPLFERAARELVACFRVKAETTPGELEIVALRFDALPVGYSMATTETLPDGRQRVRTLTAQWLPRSRTELLIADELQEEVARGGQVLEIHEAHFDGEGAGLEVTLRALPDKTFSVRGLVDGKALEGTVQAPQGLPSERALQARVHALLESHQGFDIESPSYLPALDPLALVPIRYFQADRKETRKYRSQLGAVEGAHELGERGQQIRQSIAIGSSSLVAERVHDVELPAVAGALKPSSARSGSVYVCLE